MGGEDKVTRKAVEAAGLDWREWGYFVVEMHEHQRDTLEHMTSEVARIESATGEKDRAPEAREEPPRSGSASFDVPRPHITLATRTADGQPVVSRFHPDVAREIGEELIAGLTS
jgi:hypothetical protein